MLKGRTMGRERSRTNFLKLSMFTQTIRSKAIFRKEMQPYLVYGCHVNDLFFIISIPDKIIVVISNEFITLMKVYRILLRCDYTEKVTVTACAWWLPNRLH